MLFLDSTKQGHLRFLQLYYKMNMTKESDLMKKVNVDVSLTLQVAKRPGAPHFIILLCLMPDDLTRQGESTFPQWINHSLRRLLARVLKEGVQFCYIDTSTVERGGGGGGFEKTFLWKTFEVYVTSCQYLFQARSKFFKHTWLCEFVPLCFFT